MNIRNNHVLVTGAGSGIGVSIATALSQAGAKVTITGRRQALLDTVAQQLRQQHGQVQAISSDVTKRDTIERMLDQARIKFGPVSIAIANAGAAYSCPFYKLSAAAFEQTLAVNLVGCFHTFQACIADMLDAGQGCMIAIASTAAQRGFAYVSDYSAAKHGVVGLVRSLALELDNRSIGVHAICPGYTETPMLQETIDKIKAKTNCNTLQARQKILQSSQQQRFLQPGEIAEAVISLCQTQSSNGKIITLDGSAT